MCVAVCFAVCVAVCYSVLQRVAVCCIALGVFSASGVSIFMVAFCHRA